MRVQVYYVDPETGTETKQQVRYTDEVGEHWGMTDEQIGEMENELKKAGRFWLPDARFFVMPIKK